MAKKIDAQFERFLQQSHGDLSLRLRALRHHLVGSGQGKQTEFAAKVGISLARWNNYECGHPVPRDVGARLKFYCDGVTSDWIWYGDPSGLRTQLRLELEDAMREVLRLEADHPSGRKLPRAKRTTMSRA